MNKLLRQFTRLALLLGLVTTLTLGVGYAPLYAQIEGGRILNDIGVGANRVLTSDWVELAPGEQHTYSFAHDGGDQPMTVWMDVTPIGGATFQIWTDERLTEASQNPTIGPLGAGTALAEGAGTINWQATSTGAETFHVIVSATGNSTAQYSLNIASSALSLVQPGAVVVEPVAPAVIPPADPNLAANIAVVTTNLNVRTGPSTLFPVLFTVPTGTQLTVVGRESSNEWIAVQFTDGTVGWVTRAFTTYTNLAPIIAVPAAPIPVTIPATLPPATVTPVPGQSQEFPDSEDETQAELDDSFVVLGEGESRWFTFQHEGDGEAVQVWMDVEPNEGAGFRIYDEANAQIVMASGNPEDGNDIGRGTANPNEAGDLFWRGDFEEPGTFYVLVENTWQGDISYSLHTAGPGLAGQP